jgi:ABC-2 type transport system permease protein
MGIGGPALVRLLPVILEQAGTPGMDLELPEMGPADGYLQFLEFAQQLGLLAVILVFMGVLAAERRSGLLVTLFVKPVSRLSYLTARWLINALYVALSFTLGAALALLYTKLLLGSLPWGTALAAALLCMSYVVLAFSWTFFFSSLTRSTGAAAGLALIPLFLLPVLGALWSPLGDLAPYGAVAAGSAALGGLAGAREPIEATAVLSACLNLGFCAGLLLGAFYALRRAEL